LATTSFSEAPGLAQHQVLHALGFQPHDQPSSELGTFS
jgi:hypothetical protein